MRVLGDFDIDPRPDIAIRQAHPSDRWLLCSDGVCGVLEDSTIQEIMSTISNQEECAQKLVSMALKAGSTDNATAVIADATLALDADAFDLPHQTPLIGGAASKDLESIADIVNKAVSSTPVLREGKDSPAQRAAALMQTDSKSTEKSEKIAETTRLVQPSHLRNEEELRSTDTNEIPIVKKKNGRVSTDPRDPDVQRAVKREQAEAHKANRIRKRWMRIGVAFAILVVCSIVASGAYLVYSWTQKQYYIGKGNDRVVIYQGVPTNIFGLELSHQIEETDIKVKNLDKSWQDQLDEGISFSSLKEARGHARLIGREVRARESEKRGNKQKSVVSNSDNKDGNNSGVVDSSSDSGGKTS